MALIVPDSVVELYRDVKITDKENIWFQTPAEQSAYFSKRLIASNVRCSYIRKTGRLKFDGNTAEVAQANYIAFRNAAFENKVFFARITDYEYINNSVTEIAYEIDGWQTDMFVAEYDTMVIEREHTTEQEYHNAVSNPFRDDIPELMTEEPLAVGKLLETNYINDIDAYTGGAGYQGVWPSTASETNNVIVIELALTVDISTEEGAALKTVLDENTTSYDDSIFRDNFVKGFTLLVIDPDAENFSGNMLFNLLTYLTVNSLSHNIVGFFVLPRYMVNFYESPEGSGLTFSECMRNKPGTSGDIYTLGVTAPVMQNVDPKLNRFPFSYLRLISPSSDAKEYYYENFPDVVNGTSRMCYYKAITNLNGLPSIYMCPYRYKYVTPPVSESIIIWREDLNRDESLDFTGFPQASYVTDGYLAFLSSVYTSALANKSVPARANRVLNILGTAGNIASSAAAGAAQSGVVGNPLPFIGSVGGSIAENAGAITNQVLMQLQISEAERARTSGDVTQLYSSLYNDASAAYVADEYHPGSGTGHKPYQLGLLRYKFQTVKLRDDVLERYTRFFAYYGYASKRIGVPHVCAALSGGDAPHFAEIDGVKGTYIKTANAHVVASTGDMSARIERMFNNGVRMLKGSEL